MRILLTTLNSQYIHSNPALKYLYTAASGSCDFIEIKEFTINNGDDYIFSEILAGGCGAVCFSCYIWNIERTVYLAENLKKAQPGIIIVAGGPEAGHDAAEFMRENRQIDFVVTGEGEYTFSRLAKALSAGEKNYEGIKGLAYRNGDEIIVNPSVELLVFESVPFPYSMLPCEKDKVIYYESSRGCPFKCSYCMSSLDKTVRALPVARVFREIEYFLLNRAAQVKFIDRTFNYDKARCKDIIKHIIKKDNGVTNFHFEICGELIDDDLIDLLSIAREGLFRFEAGIQSTNKRTLLAVNRSAATEKLLLNMKKLTSLGNVKVHIDLIAGLPYESYYIFKKSFNDAYGLMADELQLGFLKLLKGTQIREKAADFGYEFKRMAPYEVISSRFMPAFDICRLKNIAEMLGLFYNRGGFKRALCYAVETLADSPFAFFEEFSIFYNLKGFQHVSHKREDLYRILYEYAAWKCQKLDIPVEDFLALLRADLSESINPEVVKKFERKGWNYETG